MRFIFPALIIGLLVIAFFTIPQKESEITQTATEEIQEPSAEIEEEKRLLGDHMLENHAAASTPPALDTRIVHQFVQTANMENRHIDTFYFSTNPDLTEVLLGKEGMSHPQIKASHPIIGKNQYGEIVMVDRWKTPYRVHLMERNNIEIFSAGPDKQMGTEDDFRWPPEEPKELEN